jgi:hypothetical protein
MRSLVLVLALVCAIARELDAGGAVVRDDEVFEDGSRKAFGR